jgi:arylsulfatase
MKLIALCLCLTAGVVNAAPRPNIVIIMADDMGYSDAGCFGGEIDTPNLDALAREGVRFTQFYNTARCCPTRASLLTGLYAHQAGIGHMMEDHSATAGPAYSGELSPKALTIAEVLRGSGYRNYMAGKWHVTKRVDPKAETDKSNWPLQRGFDRFYGTIHGAGSFFDPNTLTRDNSFISPFADADYQPKEYYYTDAISDHASRFIRDHAAAHREEPFFLYIAYTSPHWPMHAKEKDIAKYKGRYDSGYEAVRAARVAKMKQLGLLDDRWQVTPLAGDWRTVEDRAWEARCMEVFAAMIDCMDQGIGRVMESLDETGQRANTLVLFLQDNGGCAEGMGRNGRKVAGMTKPTLPVLAADFLQPDMIPKQTRDGYPMRQGRGVMPGAADTYIGYGEGWANVSNTPFREYKHWEHEGGISTPLIAHWPDRIGGEIRGQLEPQVGHLIDLMATCVAAAGASYPAAAPPLEGISLLPALAGGERQARTLFWEHEGNKAVRMGDWKLVAKHGGAWELYDMVADRTEMNNLASAQPDRVAEMSTAWQAWAERVGVQPWPLAAKNRKDKAKGTAKE